MCLPVNTCVKQMMSIVGNFWIAKRFCAVRFVCKFTIYREAIRLYRITLGQIQLNWISIILIVVEGWMSSYMLLTNAIEMIMWHQMQTNLHRHVIAMTLCLQGTVRNKLQWSFYQNTKLFIHYSHRLPNGGHFVEWEMILLKRQILPVPIFGPFTSLTNDIYHSVFDRHSH